MTPGTAIAAAPGAVDSDLPAAPGAPAAVAAGAWSRAWVIVLLVLVAVATVAVFLDLPAPIRPAATIALVLLGPGMAVVRLLRLESHLAEFTLGLALSVALGGLVAGVQLYLGLWSPTRTLIVLAAVTVGALALDPDLVPRSAWGGLWRAARDRIAFLVGARPAPSSTAAPGATSGAASSQPAHASTSTSRAAATPLEPHASVSAGHEPPPPVAIVRRGQRRVPVATPPPKSRRKRQAIGTDALEDPDVPRHLRTTIDQVIDDLAQRKGAPPR